MNVHVNITDMRCEKRIILCIMHKNGTIKTAYMPKMQKSIDNHLEKGYA